MNSPALRVGLAQIQISTDDPEGNLDKHLRMLERAATQDVELTIFPELSLSGYLVTDTAEWADRYERPFLRALKEAVGAGAACVGLPTRRASGTAAANSVVVVDGSGVISKQEKLYVPNYGSYDEGERFGAGDELTIVSYRGFRLALLICEDAWHGSLAYLARMKEAHVLVHPAASASSAIDSDFDSEWGWMTICHAEALYYGTYILFVNQVGRDRAKEFWGRSKVIAPNGATEFVAPDEETLIVADLRRDALLHARSMLQMFDFEKPGFVARELRHLETRPGHGAQQPRRRTTQ